MRSIATDDFSSATGDSATDDVVTSPENRLEEILIIAYETAVEAGLEPRQAFSVIAKWLASEQLRCETSSLAAQ